MGPVGGSTFPRCAELAWHLYRQMVSNCWAHGNSMSTCKNNPRSRTIIRLWGLPVQQAGLHHFRIQQRDAADNAWEESCSIPLVVHLFRSNLRQTIRRFEFRTLQRCQV